MSLVRLLPPLTLAGLILAGCVPPTVPARVGPAAGPVPAAMSYRTAAVEGADPQSGALIAPSGRVDGYAQIATTGPTPRAQAGGKRIWQDESGDYSLNFVGVEVGEVARAVLRDVLQVPYAIDEQVKGLVSIETPRPVARKALLPILETSLRSIGAGLVITDGLHQIVPIEAARGQLAPLGDGSYGVVPVRLRYVDAAALREALAPLVQDTVMVAIDPGQNMLILSGDRAQLGNLITLVDSLDSNVLADTSFALTPLELAEARVVARELEAIFANSGGIRFLPIDRQNAILTVARNAEFLSASLAWIKRLDRRGGATDQGIYVYQVESGKAGELAATVSSLFGLAPAGGLDPALAGGPIAPTLAAAELIDPAAGGLPTMGELPPEADPALGGPAPAAPADPLDLRPQPDAAADGRAAFGGGKIKIVPHEATNTIVVMATEQDWNRIETTLRRLDQVPLQVLIEATVVEVTLNDDLRYGVQFALQSGNTTFSLTDGLSLIPEAITPGFAAALEAGKSLTVLLDALSAVTDIKVLTSPQLMVTSSKTARLQVGDQVPVPVQTASPIVSADGLVVNTIEFRDTGVILNVTPRVNPSGLISLDIQQEVSDVVLTTTSNIDAPTISQRQVASSVAVQSGETVILGGLTSDSQTRTESGIPGLRQVPLIGPLFGRTVNSGTQTELLIMIRPRIIRNSDDARAIATELRQRLDRLIAPAEPAAPPPAPPTPKRTAAITTRL
jgi:general secretion pathway protein D